RRGRQNSIIASRRPTARPTTTADRDPHVESRPRSAQRRIGCVFITKLLHAHGYRWNDDNQWHQLAPGETDPATGKAFYPPRPDSPHHLTGATQLVVDEAGMLDQEAARAFLELADRYDADVAMIGDRAQLSAVGRGGVL